MTLSQADIDSLLGPEPADSVESLLDAPLTGEDISLAAETAYVTATLVAKMTGSHIYGHMLDDHIEKFLRTCPKKTVREILSHLSHDEAAKQQHVTRHIVNSRLYSLLRQGKLKKDDSARPVWSVV